MGTILLVLFFGCARATTWVPPENPDPHTILEEAREDSRSGRFEIALAKFVWYHENALQLVPSLKGVRLSFALSDWYELAKKYPPALAAMQQARDQAAVDVLSGRDTRRSFHDLASLNRTLGQDARTQELFETLDREQPQAAETVFDLAQPALIRGKGLKLANKYVDPPADLSKMVERYRQTVQLAPKMSLPEEHREFAKRWFTRSTSTLVAILAVNGRHEEAASVAASARQELEDPVFERSLAAALEGVVPEPWP